MKTQRTLLLLSILMAIAVSAEEPPRLPIPDGWRTEDTGYPPPWAKTLPWKGKLQLRFPPGFFKADDDFFWSYPIMYWLEGDVLKTDKELERALRAYDAGLYGGQFPQDKIRIEIGEATEVLREGQTVARRRVTFHGFDPFVTKKPLTTYLEIDRWHCPDSDRTLILILRSPRKIDDNDAVRKQLREFCRKLACQ